MANQTHKKWNIEQNVLILNMFFKSDELPILNKENAFIKELAKILTSSFSINYDESALLFQLKNISSLNKKYAKSHVFLSSIMNNGDFKQFLKNPAININNNNKKIGAILTLKGIDNENSIYDTSNISYNVNLSVQSNIECLMKLLNISELEAYYLFIKNNDLIIENNDILIHKNHELIITNEITESYTNTNSVIEENNLEKLIVKVGESFDHNSEYNLLPFNDPTGTGKTHSVLYQFISKYPNIFSTKNILEKIEVNLDSKRKNLFFVAPLKNQLTPDHNIYTLASASNIPLLFLRSRQDLSSLDNKFIMKDKNGKSLSYLRNNDFWKFVFSIFDRKTIAKIDIELKKLKQKRLDISDDNEENINYSVPQLSKLLLAYTNYVNFEKNNFLLKSTNDEEYKKELEKTEGFFRGEINEIANLLAVSISDNELQKIFYTNAYYQGLDRNILIQKFNQFGTNKYLYILTYYVLMFALPLEVAKFINCVIYITGAKSQTNISFVVESTRTNKKTAINLEFEEIVSGFKMSKKVDWLKYATAGNTNNFGDCIESEMFEEISGHFFLKNNIGSSVVYDEEHILHNLFTKENTYSVITERYADSKVNILHAISGMLRWYNNSYQKSLVNNYAELVEEKIKISKNFHECLKQHSTLKTDHEIVEFLKSIKDNNYGLFIKLEEFQFIKSLCENILSFSPKKIQSKEFIESINMVLKENSDAILLTKNKQNFNMEDVKYNVFDFFQICLCLMYVLKDASSSLRTELLQNKEDNNQNLAISHLVNISFNNRHFLNNLFSSSLNLKETDPLSIQFTYFLTKIGFHFDFPKKINKYAYSPDSIQVEPQIFILKELPEVDVLKIIHNPLNRVFLLSATRGFSDIYAGNFSLNFFNEINKYVPNKIKIYDRKNNSDDCLGELIEERAKCRTINVSHLVFENKYSHNQKIAHDDIVNEVLYPVKDVSIKNLNNLADFTSSNLTYKLINSTMFNNSKHWVSKLKNTDLIKNTWNVYNKDELINIFNSIAHSVEKGQNAMVMSLSKRFYDEIINKDELREEIFGKCKKIGPEGQENKILEIPIDTSKKLKLICYDSALGKTTNLDDAFIVENGQVTILVSSFNSAGTGLNFTLQDNLAKISKDFDSIYFVNSVHYTNINGEDGFNTWSNQILIMKDYTHKGNKIIKDLEDGISSSEGRMTLETEHFMEQVKTFMQSVGRIERRNAKINTTIYFVDGSKKSLFKDVMSLFNITFNKHRNNYQNTILSNFSMLAKAVLKTSQGYVQNLSLDIKERNLLEKVTNQDFLIYQNFFCNPIYFNRLLKEYRSLNPDFYWVKEFNDIFRGYTSPNYNLMKMLSDFILKNTVILKKTQFYQPILALVKSSEFDFIKNKIKVDKEFSIDYRKSCYTDYSQSHNVVSDAYFFNYIQPSGLDLDKSVFFDKIISNYSSHNNSISKLPNIYLYHLIKGNLGEKILEEYFLDNNIVYNNIDTYFSPIVSQKIYELFDFYVIKNKTIYCIDTKNWRMYNDNAATKTLVRLPDKIATMSQIQEFNGYKLEYIYLNMFPLANNDYSKGMSDLLGIYKDVRFINFLEKDVLQLEVYKKSKNKTKLISHYIRKDGKLIISKEWRNTL